MTNQDIFKRRLKAVKFTALVSKELKSQFAKEFENYKQSMDSVQSIDPNLVKQRATVLVQSFFQGLAEKVATLQKSVMLRIKASESLKELEKILEQSREFFPNDANSQDHFEREKRVFDEKIQKGRFAYLVKRQEFYQNLIASLDQNCEKMKMTIDQSTDQVHRVLKLRTDQGFVQSKLNQIVKECIEVDMKTLDAGGPPTNGHLAHTPPQNLSPAPRSPQVSPQRTAASEPQFAQQGRQQAPVPQSPEKSASASGLRMSAVSNASISASSVFANLAPAKPHSPMKPALTQAQ